MSSSSSACSRLLASASTCAPATRISRPVTGAPGPAPARPASVLCVFPFFKVRPSTISTSARRTWDACRRRRRPLRVACRLWWGGGGGACSLKSSSALRRALSRFSSSRSPTRISVWFRSISVSRSRPCSVIICPPPRTPPPAPRIILGPGRGVLENSRSYRNIGARTGPRLAPRRAASHAHPRRPARLYSPLSARHSPSRRTRLDVLLLPASRHTTALCLAHGPRGFCGDVPTRTGSAARAGKVPLPCPSLLLSASSLVRVFSCPRRLLSRVSAGPRIDPADGDQSDSFSCYRPTVIWASISHERLIETQARRHSREPVRPVSPPR